MPEIKPKQFSEEQVEATLRENFRLSSYEARTYISLLRFGRQSLKQITTSSEVPMPRVYDTVESLMAKGFAAKQDNTYSAIPPKQALRGRSAQFEFQFEREQDERKKVAEELSRILQTANNSGKERQSEQGEISILNGFNSIANKFGELLENSSDIILLAKMAVEAKEVFIPILSEFGKGRQPEEKRIRIMVPSGTKITRKEIDEAKAANADIRESSSILFDMMVADGNDVIIGVPDPLSEEINHAIAIWVHNSSFAGSTRSSLEEVWKASKKI